VSLAAGCRQGKKLLLLSLCPHLLMGQGSPYHNGTGKEAFLPGIKWLQREANHSSPSSDKVKKKLELLFPSGLP
jgi:hypothetical protein